MSSSTTDIFAPEPGSFEPTGVPQLDRVLGGGLLRGALAIIMGPPGSGKTTLASQIAFACARRGQRILLLTAYSESTTKLLGHLQTYRFFSADLIGNTVQVFSMKQFISSGSLQGEVTAQEIVATVRQTRASMVVLDGFQGIRGAEANFAATRQLLYDLGMRLSLLGTTTLITTEADPRDPTLFPEMTTGDVLIGLYYGLEEMRSFRTLEVIKVRGAEPLSGRHSFTLNSEGVTVFPRLETSVKQHPVSGWLLEKNSQQQERARFDLAELDNLLGGGLPYRTSALLTGSLGTGKTLLGLQFALAGVAKAEPTLFLGFRETVDQLLLKADDFALGAQLREALASEGLLTLLRWEPVELDPDRVVTELLDTLERTGARRLVIDSIVELERAVRETSGERRMPNYLGALLATLRERNVTTLVIKEIRKSLATTPDFSADWLAILSENVVLLQHLAYRGKLHRTLSILKMRFSTHDHALREFSITSPEGLHVLPPGEGDAEIWQALVDFYERRGWDDVVRPGSDAVSER